MSLSGKHNKSSSDTIVYLTILLEHSGWFWTTIVNCILRHEDRLSYRTNKESAAKRGLWGSDTLLYITGEAVLKQRPRDRVASHPTPNMPRQKMERESGKDKNRGGGNQGPSFRKWTTDHPTFRWASENKSRTVTPGRVAPWPREPVDPDICSPITSSGSVDINIQEASMCVFPPATHRNAIKRGLCSDPLTVSNMGSCFVCA